MSESIQLLSPVTMSFALALIAAFVVAYLAVRLSGGRANLLSRKWPIYLLRGLLLLALLSLFFNPVRVTELKGSIKPSQVFFMLDASASMANGNENETRWDQAVNIIKNATKSAHETAAAEVNLFRFGRRLKAVDSPTELGLDNKLADGGLGVSFVEKTTSDEETLDSDSEPASPAVEPDTQMFVALRQISSRFGRKPPSAVVVFSDGRARDASRVDQVATAFSKLGVPIHTVPLGNTDSGGDVAFVSLVVPSSARKHSEVQAQAFLRSYGFDGKRVEVKLNSIDAGGRPKQRLATVPVTLKSGFQSVPISFRTGSESTTIQAVVNEQPDEVSTANNRFDADIEISREKIRVLYVEGSRMRAIPTSQNGRVRFQGPGSSLQNALQEDVDIECVVVQVAVGQMSQTGSAMGSFPKSVAELSAFDAIVLSDVPRRTFSQQQLEWIEGWVRRRGGGLCMVGGKNSFASGDWKGSPMESILPVQLGEESDWRGDVKVAIEPDTGENVHPFFRFGYDEGLNRNLTGRFPGFHGSNVGLLPKPKLAKVLAVARPGSMDAPPPEVQTPRRPRSPLFSPQGIRNLLTGRPANRNTGSSASVGSNAASGSTDLELPSEYAAITTGQYGRGRTLAMAMPITGAPAESFLKWGRSGNANQHYASYWRNVVYWLTARSYVGRRRLIATADKQYFGPGETITVSATAFDESANETSGYRLVGVIEPQVFDNIESDYSIVRWPNNVAREEETENPFIIWNEEFELPKVKVDGKDRYQIELPLAETLPSGTVDQSLRLELTAYEDYTQVDSTSIPIQILHDPFEQQNPRPDHELLTKLAEKSGGEVLMDEASLSRVLKSLPIERGPSELRRAPIWSNAWTMIAILGLVSSEWCYRRWIGLA